MRRLSKSEISNRKRPGTEVDTAAPVSTAPTAPPPAPPAVPLDRLVSQLRQAVDDQFQRSPHLMVYEKFRAADPAQSDFLSLEAAAMFEDIRKRHAADPLAVHHLAIIHHGLGFRLHVTKQDMAGKAVEHWLKGVQAWSEVVKNDAFWIALRARWQRHQEKHPQDMLTQRLLQVDVESFRRHVPLHILNLHSGLVSEYYHNNIEISRQHLRIILNSGFDASVVESVRKRLFGDHVGDLSGLLATFKFDEARNMVERYLQIDSAYVPAICSALNVCSEECKRLSAGGENYEQRLRLLSKGEPLARHGSLIQQATRDRNVLAADALRDYYLEYANAENHKAKANENSTVTRDACYRRAADYAKQAVSHEHCGRRARELVSMICWNGSMADLGTNGSTYAAARALIDIGLSVEAQDVDLVAMNAFYYYRRDDDAKFRDELRRAERLNQAAGSQAAAGLISHLNEAATTNRAAKVIGGLLQEVVERYGARNFSGALISIGQLEQYLDDSDSELAGLVYVIKAECLYLTQNPWGAKEALAKARRMAGSSPSPDLRKKIASAAQVID